jgi:hypothetical protein
MAIYIDGPGFCLEIDGCLGIDGLGFCLQIDGPGFCLESDECPYWVP